MHSEKNTSAVCVRVECDVLEVRSASISMRQAICYVGPQYNSDGFCLRGKICFHGLINVISWLDCSASICNNYPWPNNATQYAALSHVLQHLAFRIYNWDRVCVRACVCVYVFEHWTFWVGRSVRCKYKKQYAFLCMGRMHCIGLHVSWDHFWYTQIPYSHIEHHSISSFINKSSLY